MSATRTGNGQKAGDRMAELLARSARRQAAMAASGYNQWVVENIGRGEAWAQQDRGLAPQTKISKALVRKALKRSRRKRAKDI
jgi:hypothetical protein